MHYIPHVSEPDRYLQFGSGSKYLKKELTNVKLSNNYCQTTKSISHFGLAPINHFHKFSNCKKSKFQISVEGGVGVKKKARSGTDQYSDFRLDPDPRDYPFNIDLRD